MAKYMKTINAEPFDGIDSIGRIRRMIESLYPGWTVELGETLYRKAAHVIKPNGSLWCTASAGSYIVCPEPERPGEQRPDPYRRDKIDFESQWKPAT